MKLANSIKQLDLFSLPFSFQMGKNEKEKKTILGGITSLLIILLSVAYLVYLTVQFLTNQLQPKIAVYEDFSFNSYEMEFNKEMITFQINLSNGVPLLQYENQQNKRFVTLVGSIIGKNNLGVLYREDFMIRACDYDNTRYCIQFDNDEQKKTLIYNYDDSKQKQIFILISECLPQYLLPNEVCSTSEESKKLLLNLNNTFKIEISLQQYNFYEKVYQKKKKVEAYLFEKTNSFLSAISLQKANYAIKDGFLIQSKEKNTIYQEYQRNDISMGTDYLKEYFFFSLYGAIQIQLNGSYSNIEIQYPLYTEVLAQFSSILNSLLFLGLFVKMIAQSEIMQDLAEIQLQNYYKKAAFKLLSKEEIAKFSNKGISSIIELNNYISNLDFQKKWSKQLNLNFFKKLKLFLWSSFGQKNKMNLSQEQILFKNLMQQTNSSLNIYSIQKELLQIKTILKLFLTPQQYAAIQLCGCDFLENPDSQFIKSNTIQKREDQIKSDTDTDKMNDKYKKLETPTTDLLLNKRFSFHQNVKPSQIVPISNKQLDIQRNQEQNKQILNHLEKVDLVDKDPNYFKQCIETFLQNTKINNEILSENDIDQRILNCIIQIESTPLKNENRLIRDHQKENNNISIFLNQEQSSKRDQSQTQNQLSTFSHKES